MDWNCRTLSLTLVSRRGTVDNPHCPQMISAHRPARRRDGPAGGSTKPNPERLVFVKFLLSQASRLLWEPKDGAQSQTVDDGRGLNESGQDLAEYALLIGLIALVVIGAVTLLGTQLVAAYNNIAGTLPFGGS